MLFVSPIDARHRHTHNEHIDVQTLAVGINAVLVQGRVVVLVLPRESVMTIRIEDPYPKIYSTYPP